MPDIDNERLGAMTSGPEGIWTRPTAGAICLAALILAATPALGQDLPGVIRDVLVTTTEEATVLTVSSSRRLTYTANWISAMELQLTFPSAIARDDAPGELSPPAGLLLSVSVAAGQEEDQPSTVLKVMLARPASYSALIWKRRIEYTFTAREPTAAGAPTAPEQLPAAPQPAVTDSPTGGDTAATPVARPDAEMPIESEPSAPASTVPAPVKPSDAARDELTGEYRIGPGDLLEISVFGLDEFDRTVRVLRDGSLSLPLLGTVRVAQMTLQEAEATVAGMLRERQLVNDPQVSLFVKDYVSRGVSVQGAVASPGVYQMIQQRSLLEILGEAGGVSGRENDRAGDRIFVIRKTVDGGQRRIEIDAEQLVNQGRADLNILLLPGDVVLVPFAQRNRVYVSGAVNRPGPVEYLSSEGITVLQAITAAGGPTERGNLGNVTILRRGADGSETRTRVDVKKIRKGKQPDVGLERNDTVIVGEWFF